MEIDVAFDQVFFSSTKAHKENTKKDMKGFVFLRALSCVFVDEKIICIGYLNFCAEHFCRMTEKSTIMEKITAETRIALVSTGEMPTDSDRDLKTLSRFRISPKPEKAAEKGRQNIIQNDRNE